MKTSQNIIRNLISTLTSLAINNQKMPELIPVRVITKLPHDQFR